MLYLGTIFEPIVMLGLYPTLILQGLENQENCKRNSCILWFYSLQRNIFYEYFFICRFIKCWKGQWLFVLTKEIWMYSLSRANVLILQAAKHNEIAARLQMCNHSSETLLTDQYIPAQKGLCAIVRSTANANHPKKSSCFTATFRLWFCLRVYLA